MRTTTLALLALTFIVCAQADDDTTLASPDGSITFLLHMGEAGPAYTISMDGTPLFADSPLGLTPAEGEPLGPGMEITETHTADHDEMWRTVWGTQAEIRDHYRLLEVDMRDAAGRGLTLCVRAYDDAVAFRYRVPGAGEEVRLAGELTAFHLAEDAHAFALVLGKLSSAYEAGYTVGPVSALPAEIIGLPLTLELGPDKWAAITEAHLEDYAGLYVVPDAEDKLHLRTRLASTGRSRQVTRTTPFETPWRLILLGRRPGDLIESNAVLNCNPPCALPDTSWIKPGKVVWEWWSKHMVSGVSFDGGMNTETMLHYAQFAAEAGFEHFLIDEGWSWWANVPTEDGKTTRVTDITRTVPDIDMPRILDYCRENGVGLWLWLTWSHCRDQMDEAFPLYEKWGVAGVKVDFMNSDDQWMVNWYREVVRKAAEHHLMVDFHGAYKPTGMRRTLPNVMTREGVMGLEYCKWSSNVTPTHNLILPFTRMLAGPMDYTPGGFNVRTPDSFKPRDNAPTVMGTLCHQLAQYVVYESPIQMCVDYPEGYRGRPGLEFLQWVPTTWDETIVLDGYPGRFIAMARKHGDEWYVGAMSNEEGRTIRIGLDFLGGGEWRLCEFADSGRAQYVPEQVRRSVREAGPADTLEVTMGPSGGYAARLTPR